MSGKTMAQPSSSFITGKVWKWVLLDWRVEELLIAPRKPWQNSFAERIIGSIRRECQDPLIVLNEPHLKRILSSYLNYYHALRTHLSLAMDTPEDRPVQPPGLGRVVECPDVGGLQRHYECRAACISPVTVLRMHPLIMGAAQPFGALDTVFHLPRHCPPRLQRRQSNHFQHEPNGFKCSNRRNPTAMSFREGQPLAGQLAGGPRLA